jgi:hypothetical protein
MPRPDPPRRKTVSGRSPRAVGLHPPTDPSHGGPERFGEPEVGLDVLGPAGNDPFAPALGAGSEQNELIGEVAVHRRAGSAVCCCRWKGDGAKSWNTPPPILAVIADGARHATGSAPSASSLADPAAPRSQQKRPPRSRPGLGTNSRESIAAPVGEPPQTSARARTVVRCRGRSPRPRAADARVEDVHRAPFGQRGHRREPDDRLASATPASVDVDHPEAPERSSRFALLSKPLSFPPRRVMPSIPPGRLRERRRRYRSRRTASAPEPPEECPRSPSGCGTGGRRA